MNKLLIIFFTFFLFSCKEKSSKESLENDGDPVVNVESDDAAMNAAIAKAKGTFDGFIKTFKSQEENTRDYFVKMRFEGGAGEEAEAEHMWLGDLFFRGQDLFGILTSDPVFVKTHATGDTILIQREKVSDWSYVRNNILVGGYTIRVLYN